MNLVRYEHNFYELWRIMIDHKYQGKGYCKIALGKVNEEMKNFKDFNEIFLEHSLKEKSSLEEELISCFSLPHRTVSLSGTLSCVCHFLNSHYFLVATIIGV